jgi:hypothetical protein
MTGSSAAAVRRVISGLIVLAMLLVSGASLNAMPIAHSHDHGAVQPILSASTHAPCIAKSHAHHGPTDGACCVGSTCMASAPAATPDHVVRVAWSPVHYWTVDSDGSGIRPSPDLGPPITLE